MNSRPCKAIAYVIVTSPRRAARMLSAQCSDRCSRQPCPTPSKEGRSTHFSISLLPLPSHVQSPQSRTSQTAAPSSMCSPSCTSLATNSSCLTDFNQIFYTSYSDADYFRQPTRPSAQPSENWVLRFSSLKRLYRLMTQYFADVLQKPTSSLDVPNLQAIAKDHNLQAILTLCRLTIVIGVQCEKNKEFIDKIQGLSEVDQHCLMKAIEQVSTVPLWEPRIPRD